MDIFVLHVEEEMRDFPIWQFITLDISPFEAALCSAKPQMLEKQSCSISISLDSLGS